MEKAGVKQRAEGKEQEPLRKVASSGNAKKKPVPIRPKDKAPVKDTAKEPDRPKKDKGGSKRLPASLPAASSSPSRDGKKNSRLAELGESSERVGKEGPTDYHSPEDLNIEDWLRKLERGGAKGIVKEFSILHQESKNPSLQPSNRSSHVFNLPRNKLKNRYEDVACWDQTRVRLGNPLQDFIHANFVDGVDAPRKWILSQGPSEYVPREFDDTMDDFWRMVWEQRVGVIIMLCQLEEDGKNKCADYWPAEPLERVIYGDFAVTTKDADERCIGDHIVVVSKLILQKKGQKDKFRTVAHYYHKSWPDRKCPESSLPIFEFLDKVEIVQKEMATTNGDRSSEAPMVVHCSAGIGRSGTLVAIDVARALIIKHGALDILSVVRKIRLARRYAVQTHVQYASIYVSVLHFLAHTARMPPNSSFSLPDFTKKLAAYLDRL